MPSVIVLRHVPRPIIGTLGLLHDRQFDALEERLDWLEAAACVPVVRADPDDRAAMERQPTSVRRLLAAEGEASLPLVVVDGVVVSRRVYPTRTQLAHWVGSHRILSSACTPS